jgi:enoyl-CoA hydratase/carnithine racemase
MPAAKIGLQYYASGLRRFVERIGPDATKRLFLTAETINAPELLRLGFVTELRAAADLRGRVDELSSAIAGLAPTAIMQTKAAINTLSRALIDVEAVQAGHIESVRSDEHKEAMRALKEKRPPVFR